MPVHSYGKIPSSTSLAIAFGGILKVVEPNKRASLSGYVLRKAILQSTHKVYLNVQEKSI